MSSHSFQLVPFGAASFVKGLTVTGTVLRKGHELQLLFILAGDMAVLKFAETLAEPSRCDNLWQRTCFECFIKDISSSCYYELNISPNGCWNVYHFKDYRSGMREESQVTAVSSETSLAQSRCILRCSLSIANLVAHSSHLQVGLCSVLEHGTGEKSYWSLAHPGKEPDFHHPDGFILQV